MVCHTKTDADRMIFLNLVQNVPKMCIRDRYDARNATYRNGTFIAEDGTDLLVLFKEKAKNGAGYELYSNRWLEYCLLYTSLPKGRAYITIYTEKWIKMTAYQQAGQWNNMNINTDCLLYTSRCV